jgi:hypothetical protein
MPAKKTRIDQIEGLQDELDSKLSIASLNYTHVQGVASALWVINHGLNKKPQVTVVDSGENVIYGNVLYIDDNTVHIIWSSPFSGKAYLV